MELTGLLLNLKDAWYVHRESWHLVINITPKLCHRCDVTQIAPNPGLIVLMYMQCDTHVTSLSLCHPHVNLDLLLHV